jgi:hypothetical protein
VFGGRIDIGAVEQQSLNWVVDTLADESDGNYGPGDLSLREAISLARGSLGPATITFAAALTAGGPATIHLTGGEIAIRNAVNIVGPGQNLLTIDAAGNDPTPDENNGDGSRIFNVNDGNYATTIDVSISGLTLTGGDVSNWGGAILSFENTTVALSTISGNSAGIDGGGIGRFGTAIPTFGGLTVVSSTISGNSAGGSGGGIFSSNVANTTVTGSTISGNSAHVNGGGIFSENQLGAVDHLTVTGTTISGNSADASGGGIFKISFGNLTLASSTITDNEAADGRGSGVASIGDASTRAEVRSSIIAGNVHSDVDFVNGATNTFQSNGYNLIGTGNATGEFVEPGDQTGVVDPRLGPLADNGGPTLTHALLVGSPAIDAGDPAAVAGMNGVPSFDQRGNPFVRIAGKSIDIGAIESLPTPPALLGDYNHNGIVDAADFTVWRNTLGSSVTVYRGADGDGNGVVDQADCSVWKAHFGQTLSSVGTGSGAAALGVPLESGAQLAIAATQRSVLSGGSESATLNVSAVPSDHRPETAANGLPVRSAIGAVALPSDAAFTILGQRIRGQSTAVVRTAQHYATVDAAISDTLLLVRHRNARPMLSENSAQAVDHSSQDTKTRRERTGDLEDKWRTAVRWFADPVQIVG